jgi:hypothetical protein
MCSWCRFDHFTQTREIENANVVTPRRIVTLYHEGFTAEQIANIIDEPVEWVGIVIEERA